MRQFHAFIGEEQSYFLFMHLSIQAEQFTLVVCALQNVAIFVNHTDYPVPDACLLLSHAIPLPAFLRHSFTKLYSREIDDRIVRVHLRAVVIELLAIKRF